MAVRKSSRVHPKFKTKYRVDNWSEVDASLRARGDIEIWFDEDAIVSWTATPTRRRGAPGRYSDTAILTALSLGMVFSLPRRQTEGFLASVLRLMGFDLEVPDHSTLSRRRKGTVKLFAIQPSFDRMVCS